MMQRRQGQLSTYLPMDDLHAAALQEFALVDSLTDTGRRYGSGPSSATAGSVDETGGGAVPPRECAAAAVSPNMRMRDVVYATSRPSPSTTWPADNPMVRPVWMARPLAVMTDPTRAGRR